MAYKNISIQKVVCFGKQHPEGESWADILVNIQSDWTKLQDKEAFSKSLASNVEDCYMRLVQFKVQDLDTDYMYSIFFDNNRQLWDVEFDGMEGNKDVDILPNEKADLLRHDLLKKAVARAVTILNRADGFLKDVVLQHVEAGELLEVDETKLAAIQSFLSSKLFMSNLKSRTYAKA